MTSLCSGVAFRTSARHYGWQEVVGFAVRMGTWTQVERQVHEELVCWQVCRQRGILPTSAEVAAAAREFRYPRGLLSRDDLEEWLRHRSVTVEDWLGWIRGTLARQAIGADGASLGQMELPADGPQVQRAAWASVVCSGRLEALVGDLAARAAALAALFDPADPTEWPADPWERLEVALQRLRKRAVTDELVQQAISARNLDWTAIDCQWVSLGSESAAREMVLSVAEEESRDLEAVARLANVDTVRRCFLLSDVEAPLQAALLSAAPLELVGPLQVGDTWAVAQVRRKRAPSRDDPQLRAMAERVVADLAVQHEVDDRISWSEYC